MHDTDRIHKRRMRTNVRMCRITHQKLRMAFSHNMEKPDIYSSLPEPVRDLSHLIGIEPGISKKADDIIEEWTNQKDSIDDFKYKVYSLHESIEKNKSKRNKSKCLNSKQKKALFDLSNEKLDFQQLQPIHSLWKSYFDSVLSEVKTKADELKLARIDLHGAYLMVCSSKNPSVVGAKGYVLQESKNTFRILNHQNRLLSIPKCGTVFAFVHKDKLYKINGYNIMMSSFNRSKAKPKFNYLIDL